MDHDSLIRKIEELQNKEQHYRNLLDESMDPTFSVHNDGTYCYGTKRLPMEYANQPYRIVAPSAHRLHSYQDREQSASA